LPIRGPFNNELDNMVPIVKLSNGRFRAFSANSSSYRIDGATPWAMGGQRFKVLGPRAKGSTAECGGWMNSVVRKGKTFFGFVHEERACRYANNTQTHKSMAVYTSSDEGKSWRRLGSYITGQDAPRSGMQTGEGDCSVTNGHDGYLYSYCLRTSDYQTIVARAPADNPSPDRWRKYHAGAWNQNGVGGSADALGGIGMASAYIQSLQQVALVGTQQGRGLMLSVSSDKVRFKTLSAPLIVAEKTDWSRPSDSELYAYTSLIDRDQGGSDVSSTVGLLTVYLAPGTSFNKRTLVYRDMWISPLSTKPWDQVGVALSRFRQSKNGRLQTTTGPVVDKSFDFGNIKFLGYMLTQAPEKLGSIRINECVRKTGVSDYMLSDDAGCDTGSPKI
jgi:hypothetical protein